MPRALCSAACWRYAVRPMRTPLLSAALLAVASLSGCIVSAPTGDSGGQPAAPAGQPRVPAGSMVRVGANLGGKVELVGYSLDTPAVTPGQPLKVVLGLRVLEPIPDDTLVFVHVEDADGRMERMNVDHRIAGGAVPANTYKKGDAVRDEFQVLLNPGMEVRAINLYVGLWNASTDERFKLTNPDTVRNDGRDRVLLAQVPVTP